MTQGILWAFITLYAWLTTSLRQLGENIAAQTSVGVYDDEESVGYRRRGREGV